MHIGTRVVYSSVGAGTGERCARICYSPGTGSCPCPMYCSISEIIFIFIFFIFFSLGSSLVTSFLFVDVIFFSLLKGFVFKVKRRDDGQKVFVNVCQHEKVDPPEEIRDESFVIGIV